MCRDIETRYPSVASSTPGQVRAFVESTLAAEVSGDELEAALNPAVLVASELATNAVQAGTGPLVVELEVRTSSVRLTLEDDAPGWPALQEPRPDDSHGRGLMIVANLARTWGARAVSGGKQVWADIDLPPGLVHASPCPPA